MIENNNNAFNDPLSDDPGEQLRMENELLRLKLKAETGADSQSSGTLDPMLENEFLKHVLAFEQNYSQSKRIKIYNRLGRPAFKPADVLNDDTIKISLHDMIMLMDQKNIVVDFIGTYDDRLKYAFITEELFDKETDDLSIPGMKSHFCYEDYHPNHKLDIKNKALAFLSGWFKQELGENDWHFDDPFILPNKKPVSKKERTELFNKIFNFYKGFTNEEYTIVKIDFELNGDGGMGNAEGYVKYNAILESNEKIIIQGPYKIYLSYQHDWWSIFHIVFPGFDV